MSVCPYKLYLVETFAEIVEFANLHFVKVVKSKVFG